MRAVVRHELFCLQCGQAVPIAGLIPPQCPICLKEAEGAGKAKARGTWWTTMPRLKLPASNDAIGDFDRRFLKGLRIAPG